MPQRPPQKFASLVTIDLRPASESVKKKGPVKAISKLS